MFRWGCILSTIDFWLLMIRVIRLTIRYKWFRTCTVISSVVSLLFFDRHVVKLDSFCLLWWIERLERGLAPRILLSPSVDWLDTSSTIWHQPLSTRLSRFECVLSSPRIFGGTGRRTPDSVPLMIDNWVWQLVEKALLWTGIFVFAYRLHLLHQIFQLALVWHDGFLIFDRKILTQIPFLFKLIIRN